MCWVEKISRSIKLVTKGITTLNVNVHLKSVSSCGQTVKPFQLISLCMSVPLQCMQRTKTALAVLSFFLLLQVVVCCCLLMCGLQSAVCSAFFVVQLFSLLFLSFSLHCFSLVAHLFTSLPSPSFSSFFAIHLFLFSNQCVHVRQKFFCNKNRVFHITPKKYEKYSESKKLKTLILAK